jgi:hypothetical protein
MDRESELFIDKKSAYLIISRDTENFMDQEINNRLSATKKFSNPVDEDLLEFCQDSIA